MGDWWSKTVLVVAALESAQLFLLNAENLKGEPRQGCKLVWNHRECPNSFVCRLHITVLSLFMQQKYFLLWIWASQGAAIVAHSFQMKDKIVVGSWHKKHWCHTCWLCSWHQRNRLTRTKCWLPWPCFHSFQTLVLIKLWKTAVIIFLEVEWPSSYDTGLWTEHEKRGVTAIFFEFTFIPPPTHMTVCVCVCVCVCMKCYICSLYWHCFS